MEKLGLNEIREKFLSFFESKEHLRLPSFPLVPINDNSLLLINSGMAPLKPYFTGEQIPPRYRVTTCQKCIRTPDIERVGKTARHGTFFEMLGNFSFGNYFKKEATRWAWEFATEVMEMPVDRLWVTIYQDDDEAFDIWTREVGVSPDRIVRLGKDDNFWEIGTGPCGPCSEIYFDRGPEYSCGSPTCAVGCDCDRYVEFWNLVFTQFSRDEAGEYSPLEKKNIDTGMGLERLACIMQGVDNIFEVDTIKNIRDHVCRVAGVTYGEDAKTDVSVRVITDHIRSTTMMISDGVIPSNEGRGYVLRRLLRRAARHGKLLGVDRKFLFEICDTVIAESKNAYPALYEKAEYIKKVIETEEDRFKGTIDTGLGKLEDIIAGMKERGETVMSGEDTFRLSDTYGFPIDLTMEILSEQGLSCDREEFDKLMNEQRERARVAREKLGDFGWFAEDLGLDKAIKTQFVGYDSLEADAKVLAIIGESGKMDMALGGKVTVVLDRTSFYAESGGQVGDTGVITADGCSIRIDDVRKTPDGKFLHMGQLLSGVLKIGDTVKTSVDADRRRAIMRAHSATHMLQKALRETLGTHVEQAGSLVMPDHLRFDFTHFAALTDEELSKVEARVNEVILSDIPVNISEMPIDEAKKLGAMALFGEKYGDIVRVVRMGDYSVEFCGGTHIGNTAKAGALKILSESSVAAGVRRIEAVTGSEVVKLVNLKQEVINNTAAVLKTTPTELVRRSEQITAELRETNRRLSALRDKMTQAEAVNLIQSAKDVGGVRVLAAKIDDADVDRLRVMGDMVREKNADIVSVLASVSPEGKIVFAAACGADAVKRGAHAGNILRQVAKIAGGGGGGRPDSATAGGKDVSKLQEAIDSACDIVAGMLKN